MIQTRVPRFPMTPLTGLVKVDFKVDGWVIIIRSEGRLMGDVGDEIDQTMTIGGRIDGLGIVEDGDFHLEKEG